MFITCVFSLIVFVISLIISYIWINFLGHLNLLFLLPIVLGIFILLYLSENYIVSKYKLNKTIYNVVTIQIPAIICILISLILWILNFDPLTIRIFLYACKDILIPILILRLFTEFLIKGKISLIVSIGISLGLMMGILAINSI